MIITIAAKYQDSHPIVNSLPIFQLDLQTAANTPSFCLNCESLHPLGEPAVSEGPWQTVARLGLEMG